MHTESRHYHHKGEELHGFLAYDKQHVNQRRPAVLVAHDWSGRNDFACNKALMLAGMGYIGFALDMYGAARTGSTTEERMALMQPIVSDRQFLRDRILAAFDEVKSLPHVDPHKIAAIGFCFGGLCVLDLARSGADIAGVVSLHGILVKPDTLKSEKIKAKVLALHGYDDPMVKPAQVDAFCQEMTEANADWQVHQYGHTKHAFTNPQAHDNALGTVFNPVAEQRAIQSMSNFLQEIFR